MPLELERVRRPSVILHYHAIARLSRAEDPHNLAVSPARLRSQLASLSRRGYEFVDASEFAKRIASEPEARGLCALTFDDGTVDNLEYLPGLLSEFGAKATVYVCPGLSGQRHMDFGGGSGIRFMTDEEIVELSRVDGIEIGSHTLEHTPLHNASAADAFREMSVCKDAIEALLGTEVTSFAYPSCGYSEACPEAAERAGYTNAVTCVFRGSREPFELRRESITSLDGRLVFELKSRELWSQVHGSALGRLGRRIRWGRQEPGEPHPSAAPPDRSRT